MQPSAHVGTASIQKGAGDLRRDPTKGLMPDVIMYTAAISSCEKRKHPKRALELFGEMQQSGL
jgi:pentatricopeptide repeat protein